MPEKRGYWKTVETKVWIDVPDLKQGDHIIARGSAGSDQGIVIGFNSLHPELVIYATEKYHGSTTSVWNCELVSRGNDYKRFLQRWIDAHGRESILDEERRDEE
jgi:hypothetical protein